MNKTILIFSLMYVFSFELDAQNVNFTNKKIELSEHIIKKEDIKEKHFSPNINHFSKEEDYLKEKDKWYSGNKSIYNVIIGTKEEE